MKIAESDFCWAATNEVEAFEMLRYRTALKPGDTIIVCVDDKEETGIVIDNNYKDMIIYGIPVMGEKFSIGVNTKAVPYIQICVPCVGKKVSMEEVRQLELRSSLRFAIESEEWETAKLLLNTLKEQGEDISEFEAYSHLLEEDFKSEEKWQ